MEVWEHIIEHGNCRIKILRTEEYPCNLYEQEEDYPACHAGVPAVADAVGEDTRKEEQTQYQ